MRRPPFEVRNAITDETLWAVEVGATPSRGDLQYSDGSVRPLSIPIVKTFKRKEDAIAFIKQEGEK